MPQIFNRMSKPVCLLLNMVLMFDICLFPLNTRPFLVSSFFKLRLTLSEFDNTKFNSLTVLHRYNSCQVVLY